jgi:pimeloyl-ACP methyl ester carboxylesterase
MNQKLLKYNNGSVFYRETGEGTPVILVHGFGEDGNIWEPIVEALSNHFHLIIPDLPGSGNSEMLAAENYSQPGVDKTANEQHPSIEDFAEIIKYIMDDLSIDECVLIGHSMGGYITLAFAEKYPEKLLAFGLFHSSAFADDQQKIEIRLKAIDFIKSNGAQQYLKTSIPNLFADKFKRQHPEKIEDLIVAGNRFTSAALIQYCFAMINRPDRTGVLQRFQKPVLFIMGEKDSAVPMQTSLQQCYIPEISFVHVLPEAGHMGMLETPDTGNLLSRFIDYAVLQPLTKNI